MSIQIIPAILPMNFAEVEEKVSLVKGLVKTVQIDVCDGRFVSNATWPYRKHDDFFEKIVNEEDGLPAWQDLDFELDMMVDNPKDKVAVWISAGVSRVILHVEAKGDLMSTIEIIGDKAEIGLALNIDTPISSIEPFKDKIKLIQLMGIDHIGFQGQTFDPKVIDKIKEIKNTYPDFVISVDGGVSLNNAKDLINAGANRLVVGSAIFDADNYIEALHEFKSMV